jgi:hypothetical protein
VLGWFLLSYAPIKTDSLSATPMQYNTITYATMYM